jgi:competence ComEA-like helix-hairpin-helix protein
VNDHDELMENAEETSAPEPSDEAKEAMREAVEVAAEEAEPRPTTRIDDEPEEPATEEEETVVVDLNTASEDELQQLPGIGPALAARIVNHRVEVQPFEEPADLLAVPGISQGLYDNIADRLIASPVEQEAEEIPDLDLEPEPLEEDVAFDLEPEFVEEVPVFEAEEEPAPKPEPPPLVAVSEVQVAGWGRVLFVGLLSAIIGAILALAILYGLNGTLDFQSATARVRAEAFQLEEQIEGLGIELGNLQTQLDNVQDLGPVVEEMRGDIQELNGDVAAAQVTLDELVEAVDGLRPEYTNLREDLDGLAENVSLMDKQLGEIQGRIGAMEEQLATMTREVAELEQSAERFDAFLDSLRHFLNERMGPPTPTAWATPTPKPKVTVIPLATPTSSP